MPRLPLADTPGLPPYGQRSSERRKEQNRLAQRQLRERRQQQEAAQALKLQQQQNEIRRLNRLITELRSENFNLKNQSTFRRRQSVIPISSLSRGLSHVPAAMSAGTGLGSNSKPLFARHSIDYSSLHGAYGSSSDASNRLHEQRVFKHTYSEDMSCTSDLREPIARSNILQPTRLTYDQLSQRTLALTQGRSFKAANDGENVSSDTCYGIDGGSPIASSGSSRQQLANPIWLSSSRNTTPTAVDGSGTPWLASPQKLASKAESGFLTLPSVNLASFWPARPPSPPSNPESHADLDHFSDSSCNMSVVPAEFFPAANPVFSNNRVQSRKASASAHSDTSSSLTTSILQTSDSYSPVSGINADSVQFPFGSQEFISADIARSMSPTAIGSSPEIKVEDRNLGEIESSICFRSPFSDTNKLEISEQSPFGLRLSCNETVTFNVETLSPFPTYTHSLCSMDVNEIWGSDY